MTLIERENPVFRNTPLVYDGVANAFTCMELPLKEENGKQQVQWEE